MSTRNLTINSPHGVERLYIRATPAQKHLIKVLREDKDLFIRQTSSFFKLFKKGNSKAIKVLNTPTVEKLLDQDFLHFVSPTSNIIRLTTTAKITK